MKNEVYIAIPLLDELDNLALLFKNLEQQSYPNFKLFVCVNQPDEWWNDEHRPICLRNKASIKYLQERQKDCIFPIIIIDKSSPSKGWIGKKVGVGWARKTLMETIGEIAKEQAIIISLDGDTSFGKNYVESIVENFLNNKNTNTISVPYYHSLGKDEAANRAILRYEIYMRYYALNLMYIRSPYAFSALGSAIAFKYGALKKIGGFTPKKSGEDFYFLQKMIKYKGISIWNKELVYPAARFSDRVFFGTGPAMIKGHGGDWSSYPLYPVSLFTHIHQFYQLIPELYLKNISTPIDSFLGSQEIRFKLYDKLRNNNKDLAHFSKAIHDYFDGLKILQYLKQNYSSTDNEEQNLIQFIAKYHPTDKDKAIFKNISFKSSSTAQLNAIRDYLCRLENSFRKRQQNIPWRTNS